MEAWSFAGIRPAKMQQRNARRKIDPDALRAGCQKKKASCRQLAFDFLVGGARFELATNGLKVQLLYSVKHLISI